MIQHLLTEQYMAPFFELTPDLVCIAGKDGFFRKVNPAAIQKLGYSEQELKSRPIDSFIHPKDRSTTSDKRKALIKGIPLLNFQNRYITKQGNVVWLDWTSIYFEEREVVFAIAKDITDRKLMENGIQEKYLQFKDVAQHFKNRMEQEKKLLATELHEELAQLASVVKMEIEWIRDYAMIHDSTTQKRVEHVLDISSLLVNTIRKIAYEISPNMLYDVGLKATLEWLCNQFSSGEVNCTLQFKLHHDMLKPELQLDIFRICQDALNHISKNEKTRNVSITLTGQNNAIDLSICDDGSSFIKDGSYTIPIGIRERTASLHGELITNSSNEHESGIIVHIELSINNKIQHHNTFD